MKKCFWLTALAGVALASCVNEVPVIEDKEKQPQELKFGNPVMSKQSRAIGEITGSKYPDDESFVVFSVIHDGAFAGWENSFNYKNKEYGEVGKSPYFPEDGVVVSRTGNNTYWHIEGSKTYYWPENEVKKDEDGNELTDNEGNPIMTDYKMTFAAYSPASLGYPANELDKYCKTISYGKTGLNIEGYQMPDDPAKHFDLLFSTRTTDVDTSPVAINFKHALASIRFMFVKQAEATGGAHSITIKKITLIGEILNKGNFVQEISDVTNSTGNPSWKDLTIVKNDVKNTPDNLSDDEPKEYVLYDDAYTVPENTTMEIDGIHSFMAIPQSVNDKMKVRIEYDVVMKENDAPTSNLRREIPFTYFKLPSSTLPITNWHRSNRYVYTIQFGALKEIFFIPTISEDWTTEGNSSFFTIGKVDSNENTGND